MKAKMILTTIMAVSIVTVLGFAVYAMDQADKTEKGNMPMSTQHHSNKGDCPYMSSHAGSHRAQMGSHRERMNSSRCPQMGSHTGSARHMGNMGNHIDADDTC